MSRVAAGEMSSWQQVVQVFEDKVKLTIDVGKGAWTADAVKGLLWAKVQIQIVSFPQEKSAASSFKGLTSQIEQYLRDLLDLCSELMLKMLNLSFISELFSFII